MKYNEKDEVNAKRHECETLIAKIGGFEDGPNKSAKMNEFKKYATRAVNETESVEKLQELSNELGQIRDNHVVIGE